MAMDLRYCISAKFRQASWFRKNWVSEYHVELAMRYQNPSICYQRFREDEGRSGGKYKSNTHCSLQYASASTGSVIQSVMELVSKWPTVPPVSFVNSFHDNDLDD
jgi:ferrochelatase